MRAADMKVGEAYAISSMGGGSRRADIGSPFLERGVYEGRAKTIKRTWIGYRHNEKEVLGFKFLVVNKDGETTHPVLVSAISIGGLWSEHMKRLDMIEEHRALAEQARAAQNVQDMDVSTRLHALDIIESPTTYHGSASIHKHHGTYALQAEAFLKLLALAEKAEQEEKGQAA